MNLYIIIKLQKSCVMLTLLRKLKKLVFSFSYFQATQYFRFRKEEAYVHTSAGVASIILQFIVLSSLIFNLVGVFTRSTVMVTISDSYNYPPASTTISMNSNFMVAIQSFKSSGDFSIKYFQNDETAGNVYKDLLGIAEPCTLNHWSFIPNIQQNFQINNMGSWMCMPINATFLLEGKKNARTNKYLSIEIQCPSCSTNSSVQQLIIHYSNALINPSDSQKYLAYYINSDYTMTMKYSLLYETLSVFMEDFSISSDISFFPWYYYLNEKGIVSGDSKIEVATTSANAFKAQIMFRKSSKSKTYTRNFLKILDAFYFIIGSFTPTLVTFAFFIHPILASIFQMRFATYVYRLEEGRKYGVLEYFTQAFYSIFKNVCKLSNQKWARWEKIAKARETLNKVMEVQYLYERIQFLENSLKLLFEDHHLCGLRLIKKDTIVQASEKYRRYKFRKNIKKLITKQQKQQLREMAKIAKKQNVNTSAMVKKLNQNNENIIPSSGFIRFEGSFPRLRYQEQELPHKYQLQQTKHFQFDDSQYQSDDQYNNLDIYKQSYMKIVEDFNRLKQQAESEEPSKKVSKRIYQLIRKPDIQLMQQFSRKIGVQKKIQSQPQVQSNIIYFRQPKTTSYEV